MAFFFKSKKGQPGQQPGGSGLPPASRNIHTSDGPVQEKPPLMNGDRSRDAARIVSPTPSGSINNSLSSVTNPGSPDPNRVRQRADSETQVRSMSSAGNGSPTTATNAALFPWSQRRLNFASPNANPFPRYGAAINSIASKEGDMYMMGGLVDGSTVKGDLWMVESSGGTLSCSSIATVSEGPGPRVGHSSLLVGNAFIVFGGDTKINEDDALDDTLYLLNTSSRQWSRAIPPGPRPSGRYGHTLNILGSKLYVFGGQVDAFFFNDLVAFDLNALQNPANKWEFLIRNTHDGGPPAGQIPPPRTNHTTISFNDKLYLFGGTNGSIWFNDVWCYDPNSNTWSLLDCTGFVPSPREGHAAALVGDTMYVFGGRNEEGIDMGDLSAFRITNKRWFSFHNMGPAPSPRSGHSMTAFGRQIIVLGGEPSSAPRDPTELSMAYILDTSKIRYPSEPAQNGDRPSDGRNTVTPTGRISREAQNTMTEQPRRGTASHRESMMGSTAKPQGDSTQGSAGSRLPRASIAQAPAGPPPPGQAPTPVPRMNGQASQGPRSKTPTKQDRSAGYQGDAIRTGIVDRDTQSPAMKFNSSDGNRTTIDTSSASGGRRTPSGQPPSRMAAKMEAGEAAPLMSGPTRQRSLQKQRQRASMDSTDESVLGRQASMDGSIESRSHRNSRVLGDEPRSPRLTPHQEALIKELEAARNRNAWYASELALARKAGYNPSASSSSALEEQPPDAFTDEDRPLIEAFLSMRAELAKMQATVDRQASIASKRVAEVEHQRDAAISEAAYARAKLAAHGGSQRSTPQLEGSSRADDDANNDRTSNLSRRLAIALAAQADMKTKLESMTVDLEQEKRARELAEGTSEATRKRLAELEMQSNALELESLRAELHQLQAHTREETALRAEAEAKSKQANLDKEELSQKLEDVSSRLKDHTGNMTALREAVAASTAKAALMERHLEEERERREGLERKLLQLRADHEAMTAELETANRRLKEAEELAESHAREAESHKLAFISGLDRASSIDSDSSIRSITDQRVIVLQSQVDAATKLAKSNQSAADEAAEKLRRAEERIAGLEAYQEQVSREGLQLRRQLQTAIKDSQAMANENKDLKMQLEAQHRDASALAIQHGALKDLLGERGVHASDSRRSPLLDSPGSRFGTPEQSRLRELEQQLQASMKAHDETKVAFESREQEADRAYREKLEQLENDYQSAVHYVKGTEKMLKRMKDELARYKTHAATLQSDLETAQKNAEQSFASSSASASWEKERADLQNSLSELQTNMSTSISGLESQISKLKEDLSAAQNESKETQSAHEAAKKELLAAADQSRVEIEQLKEENSLLESRALHAEQRVTMLLEQMVTSVENHRRQSQHGHGFSSISRTQSNASTATAGGPDANRPRGNSNVSRDDSFLDNRSSMALDSLANELDALRNHWESTNRSHRLSSTFDLDATPTKETHEVNTLSESVSSWRRRLEEEEARASSPIVHDLDGLTTPTAATHAVSTGNSSNMI